MVDQNECQDSRSDTHEQDAAETGDDVSLTVGIGICFMKNGKLILLLNFKITGSVTVESSYRGNERLES